MQSFPHDRLWLINAIREEDIRRANDARRSKPPREHDPTGDRHVDRPRRHPPGG